MKKKKPETRGRHAKPAGTKQKNRAICWLDDADKATLQEHSTKFGQSESAILRAGLVALGVLAPTPHV